MTSINKYINFISVLQHREKSTMRLPILVFSIKYTKQQRRAPLMCSGRFRWFSRKIDIVNCSVQTQFCGLCYFTLFLLLVKVFALYECNAARLQLNSVQVIQCCLYTRLLKSVFFFFFTPKKEKTFRNDRDGHLFC